MQVGNMHCSGLPLSCSKGAFLAVLPCREVRWRGQRVSSPWNRGHPTGLSGLLLPGCKREERLGYCGIQIQWSLAQSWPCTRCVSSFHCAAIPQGFLCPRQAVRHCQKAPSPWLPTNSSRRLSDTERRIMNAFGINKLPKQCPLCLKSH